MKLETWQSYHTSRRQLSHMSKKMGVSANAHGVDPLTLKRQLSDGNEILALSILASRRVTSAPIMTAPR
jgi:hypothetical protein